MRTFWLIGASSGIGKALAHKLTEQGWQAAISARSAEVLEKMAAENPALHAFPLDVTDPETISNAFKSIESEMGEIDTCLFNAGDYTPMPLDEFDSQLFRQLIEVNYMGAVNLLNTIIPPFTHRGRGRILLTGSLAAYRGLPRSAPYGASKAALLNMAESLKLELKQKGVVLRVINPGFVRTPLTDKNSFKMPSLIDPEQAAKAICRELEASHFEIRFPKGFAWAMNLLRVMPYRLYFYLTRKAA